MEMTINQFLANPMAVEDYTWRFFDWFCTDRGLKNRMMKLKGKVAFLVKSGLIDGDTHYVIFKNNCPCDGDLYDDLRVVSIDTDEIVCGLAPSVGYSNKKGHCEFWTFDEDGCAVEQNFSNYKSFKEAVKSGQVTLAQ